jgi:hypothetical protein
MVESGFGTPSRAPISVTPASFERDPNLPRVPDGYAAAIRPVGHDEAVDSGMLAETARALDGAGVPAPCTVDFVRWHRSEERLYASPRDLPWAAYPVVGVEERVHTAMARTIERWFLAQDGAWSRHVVLRDEADPWSLRGEIYPLTHMETEYDLAVVAPGPFLRADMLLLASSLVGAVAVLGYEGASPWEDVRETMVPAMSPETRFFKNYENNLWAVVGKAYQIAASRTSSAAHLAERRTGLKHLKHPLGLQLLYLAADGRARGRVATPEDYDVVFPGKREAYERAVAEGRIPPRPATGALQGAYVIRVGVSGVRKGEVISVGPLPGGPSDRSSFSAYLPDRPRQLHLGAFDHPRVGPAENGTRPWLGTGKHPSLMVDDAAFRRNVWWMHQYDLLELRADGAVVPGEFGRALLDVLHPDCEDPDIVARWLDADGRWRPGTEQGIDEWTKRWFGKLKNRIDRMQDRA